MAFSSQFYYTISLTTWGIIFMYLGFTTMIRNVYNPFAEPVLVVFILLVFGVAIPMRFILKILAGYAKLWDINVDDNMRIDVGAINRLDKENNMRRMIRSIQ